VRALDCVRAQAMATSKGWGNVALVALNTMVVRYLSNTTNKNFEFDFSIAGKHNPAYVRVVPLLSTLKRGKSLRHDAVPIPARRN